MPADAGFLREGEGRIRGLSPIVRQSIEEFLATRLAQVRDRTA